jgi:hypothetical protein
MAEPSPKRAGIRRSALRVPPPKFREIHAAWLNLAVGQYRAMLPGNGGNPGILGIL